MSTARFGLEIVAFDPRALGVRVRPRPGSTADVVRTWRAVEILAQDPTVQVAIDGPMYDDLGAGNARILFRLRDRAAGVDVPSQRPGAGLTLAVTPDGHVHVAPGDAAPSDASVAIQLYPALLRDGGNVVDPATNTDSVWRAALGVLGDGRLAVAVGIGPMATFAARLAAAGFLHAGYLDGGHSTSLLERGHVRVGHPEDQAVASWVVATRSPPALVAVSTGVPLWAAALLAVTAAGGAWWVVSRTKW